jgi:hypothetical protein
MWMRTLALISTLALLGAAAPIDRRSPSVAVSTFYAWHLNHPISNPVELLAAKPYLTTSLYDDLKNIEHYQRCLHAEFVDGDPFSGAQVGIAAYSIGATTIDAGTALVPVQLTFTMPNGRRFAGKPITVAVVREADGWRINDVVTASDGSLAASLRKTLLSPTINQHLTATEAHCLSSPS